MQASRGMMLRNNLIAGLSEYLSESFIYDM
jgi:hypothetical protein